MRKAIDLTGKRYGRLTVVSRAQNQNSRVMWNCLCDCGKEKTVRASSLRRGVTRSCGCLCKESFDDTRHTRRYKHGGARHGENQEKLYFTWLNMRYRCEKQSDKNYKNYGARGISVCKEWQDYGEFRKWAYENGYNSDTQRCKNTLDRIDVNGNYEPSNCRWVDMKIQQNNRRNNRRITYNGETRTMAEWAEKIGISQCGLMYRLNNWSVKDAMETPIIKTN